MAHTPSRRSASGETSLKDETPQPENEVSFAQYPNTKNQILVMISLYLSIFLIVLDQNIISVAVPRITDQFHSLDDIAWYGSAYFLTMCSFQLLMGKVYKFYPAKPIFIAGITLFEVGSAVSGAAHSSKALIVGRAISGLGASGLFSGLFVIMFHVIPLKKRPLYQGFFGATFAIGSVVGPLIGGSFTDKVTWRWCFYINLPIGAVVIAVIIFILHLPHQKLDERAPTLVGKIKQLDPIGNLVFFPGVICLILALQWGGTKYNWGNVRIVILFIIFGLCTVGFILIQLWKQDAGVMPPRIVKQRSIAAAMVFGFLNSVGMVAVFYYLPIWFQAIKNVNPIDSGIRMLPTVISTVVASIISGVFISKIGYYAPFFILSSIIVPIASGLFTTFTPTTTSAKWIGYQVLFGFGLGFGMQQPANVVQTVLSRSDVSTGAALIMFVRFMGQTVFLSIAQNIFLNRLVSKLTNLPNINIGDVINGGAIELRHLASGDSLNILLNDYNTAIIDVFYMVVVASALTLIPSLFIEWRSLKARAAEQDNEDKLAKDARGVLREKEEV